MTERPLQGKVAVVTGAGSPIGMGYAMTLGLVRAGARVAMMDVKQEWLDLSGNQARELGGDGCVLPILADVSDPESVRWRWAGLSPSLVASTSWSTMPALTPGPRG